MDCYDFYQSQLAQCDQLIASFLAKYSSKVDIAHNELVRTQKRTSQKNAVAFDMEFYAHAVLGVNLMAIPGMSSNSMLQIVAELGHDFTNKFDSCAKFSKWCNLTPQQQNKRRKAVVQPHAKTFQPDRPSPPRMRKCSKKRKDRDGSIFPKNEIKKWA